MISFMLIFWAGQAYTGWKEYNNERSDYGKPGIEFKAYLSSGHFLQATFENWESEFLQMALYVVLTVSLRQKGSSESKKLYEPEEVDREPKPSPAAPWPVNKGGIWLKLYSHSLSIAFFLLFMVSFYFHFRGSIISYNEEQLETGKPTDTWQEYIVNTHFWFESFQNWQSEFLAVGSIVVLSIWLRQKGSPESKPVDAPHWETEE
jgi:hypothetical protein